MSNVPVFVGLDYHQDAIQVCVLNSKGDVLLNRSASNDCDQLARLVNPLGQVRRVGIEACCGSAALGQELVDRLGWNVSLGHPAYIARMKGSPDKTDYSDGRLLADLTRVGYLPSVWLAPAKIRELRQLVNHRQRLVDHGRALKLQAGAVLREQRVKISSDRGSRWSKTWSASLRDNQQLSEHARWIVNDLLDEIAHTQKRIEAVAVKLREATQGDAVVSKLMEQEGIGEVTAWVLRACIGDFSRFKRAKQLSRYCGLSPCNASSGNKVADAGLIDGCNKVLRMTIIQAAHRLMRTSDRWSKLAASLKARGKPACVIVGAVGNRWVRTLHHAMKGNKNA
ncbi:MAG TPA: IS110 family transposase [Acidobacteriaceae bacterium]|nr:IS110 family transposase [Acidobacteriaceae bacterium]